MEKYLTNRLSGILDYPQKTLDLNIWNIGKKVPILKGDVKEAIIDNLYSELSNSGLSYFEDWITNLYFIGSSATYQWEEDSDIDITCIIDTGLFMEKEQRPDLSDEEIMELLKEIANKQANGKLLKGTNHPINYFFRDNELDEDATDAIYDIRKDIWIKFPSKTEISDFREVINKAVSWARKIDLDKGELWRDTVDYEKLRKTINRLQGNDREKVKERLQEKVNEISDGLEILIQTGKTIHKERLQAFEEKLENGEVPSKNWLPENIIYKFLERWNYIQLLKDLKEIDTLEEIPKIKEIISQYLPNSVPEVQIYTIQSRFQDDPKLGQYISSHKSSVPGVYKVYDIYRKDGYTVYTIDPMNKMADMALAVNFETYREAVDYVRDTMVKRAQHKFVIGDKVVLSRNLQKWYFHEPLLGSIGTIVEYEHIPESYLGVAQPYGEGFWIRLTDPESVELNDGSKLSLWREQELDLLNNEAKIKPLDKFGVRKSQTEKLKPLSEFESVTLEDGTQVLYATEWPDIGQGLIGAKPEEFTDNMVMLFFVNGGTFHMNGVFFPIDIAFLDEEGKILKLERMIPNESYVPAPAGTVYALETNVNWYKNRGLEVGGIVPFIKMEEGELEIKAYSDDEVWVPLSDWKYQIGADGTKILIADTWDTLCQGIMKSKPQDFPGDTVMLFVLGEAIGYKGPFHMQDCLFSIHIAFLDKDFRILKIYTATPETSGYEQPANSAYALETNISWFDKKGLKEGDIVPLFEQARATEEQYPNEEVNTEDYGTKEGQKQKYALITGFDKFAGYVKNPSFEVARKLEGKTIAGYKIQIAKLPVEYGTSAQMVTDIVKEIKPDVVIALGLAFYGTIAIEATAYKCESTVEKIPGLTETPEQVDSNLPVSNIITKWESEEIPGIKGYNPGAFVCEHIMYTLYTLEDLSKKGFIHVPRPEEMSLEVMVKAVIVALEETAKAVEQEQQKTAQTEIKFAQWDHDDVMNKRVRNEYYVSVSNEYLVQEDNTLNSASDYPEHMLPDEVWGKIVAKYYDYPSAIAHAGTIYDGIVDVEKPSKENINSVFVEDYLSGELFSGQMEAFLANTGTADEEWEYSKSARESTEFTDKKLKEIGYQKGIMTTKEEIDGMDVGVTIKPLDKFGQTPIYIRNKSKFQPGELVVIKTDDIFPLFGPIKVGDKAEYRGDDEFLMVSGGMTGYNFKVNSYHAQDMIFESFTPEIEPLTQFG